MWKILMAAWRVGRISEPAPDCAPQWATPATPADQGAPGASGEPEMHGALDRGEAREGERIQREILGILGRALTIREVDAGSCNGCELEIHALNNPYYNLEGLGIKFVASPRHADMLLVTGPVSRHMAEALRRTWEATPAPKLVVAVGECACNGGVFGEGTACCGAVSRVLPVDVAIPGCPPPPLDLLRGILTAVRRCAPTSDEQQAQAGKPFQPDFN